MCGIVGYKGPRDIVDVVFEGLKRLEYRGYDSAGIAVLNGGGITLEKASGKLKNLQPYLKNLPQECTMGLGHTRWATHGGPTKENAHPHRVGEVALAHNGIIENYSELKDELRSSGADFRSQTDSEVIAHLLSIELQNGQTPRQALNRVIERVKGAWALGIIFQADPDFLYLAKHGSPLVVGISEGEIFFGSDATAFAGEANQAVFLDDGQCGRISPARQEYWDFDDNAVEPTHVPLNWSRASVEKQGYRHFMLKEIHEQPVIIAETVNRLVDLHSNTFNASELGFNELNEGNISGIHMVACGTAYLAGRVAAYFLEPLLGIPVNVELASEFRYRDPFMRKETLVIAISQSGETADTLACVKHARQAGCQVFTVCNVLFSSIPRESTSNLYMDAGQEIGVASTKAFTSQVLCLYLWGLALAHRQGRADDARIERTIQDLRHLPLLLDTAIGQAGAIDQLARKYYESKNFIYVGRGTSYPIAMEGALKLKEISYIHAEGYAAGELKHGPIALIDRHMPVVAIAPRDQYYEKTVSNIEEICAREGRVIGIGHPDDQAVRQLCEDFIPCPGINHPVFQAILTAIPVQFLAYYIAVHRGTDVDQPRNLAKSVTVE